MSNLRSRLEYHTRSQKIDPTQWTEEGREAFLWNWFDSNVDLYDEFHQRYGEEGLEMILGLQAEKPHWFRMNYEGTMARR